MVGFGFPTLSTLFTPTGPTQPPIGYRLADFCMGNLGFGLPDSCGSTGTVMGDTTARGQGIPLMGRIVQRPTSFRPFVSLAIGKMANLAPAGQPAGVCFVWVEIVHRLDDPTPGTAFILHHRDDRLQSNTSCTCARNRRGTAHAGPVAVQR